MPNVLVLDEVEAHGMRRAYESRGNVTAYDATYAALAEGIECELLTADRRLARATGPRCAIRVLP